MVSWKMSVLVATFLVPVERVIYLLEMMRAPPHLIIWEIRTSQERRESVVLVEGSHYRYTLVEVYLREDETMGEEFW